ncbi:hypothetical protein THAOC_10700, partial [Thalassiosira oceanica]
MATPSPPSRPGPPRRADSSGGSTSSELSNEEFMSAFTRSPPSFDEAVVSGDGGVFPRFDAPEGGLHLACSGDVRDAEYDDGGDGFAASEGVFPPSGFGNADAVNVVSPESGDGTGGVRRGARPRRELHREGGGRLVRALRRVRGRVRVARGTAVRQDPPACVAGAEPERQGRGKAPGLAWDGPDDGAWGEVVGRSLYGGARTPGEKREGGEESESDGFGDGFFGSFGDDGFGAAADGGGSAFSAADESFFG